jgi:eukaryotic-like serine/threonine-protein kinase
MPLDPQRVKSVFLAAMDRSAGGRGAFLDEACAGDAELRQRVDKLLHAHDRRDSLPEGSADSGATAGPPPDEEGASGTAGFATPEAPGTVVGPYRLLRPIGGGGMGAVWLAQQTQPVRRQVALKLIKPGMDSRQVLARFEQERQALALMDHDHIARVFDAGTTEAGRPYFVMELVNGVPITKYCDELHLPLRERLDLFVRVCQAIQHAHTKGVIHRDVKPSNVLVCTQDGRPVPKVIDFGIAKALHQPSTGQSLYTETGQVVGTLEYMSPEQAEISAPDVDTRADVYALGVLLYELLTGTTPLNRKRLGGAPLLELLRVIREEEPPRPSTRLGESGEELAGVAARRRAEPARLTKAVRGELDWIAMRCLEKDRARRYETANGLARDVQRYLADEPVEAGPPSAGYRLRKFIRRSRRLLATAAVLALAALLAIGSFAGSVGWALRDRAERRAELGRERAARREKVDQALDQADTFLRRQQWAQCRAVLAPVERLLAGGTEYPQSQGRLGRIQADLDMGVRLEEARLEKAAVKDGAFDSGRAARACATAFRVYGLPVLDMPPEEAAERIKASSIREALLDALLFWRGEPTAPAERKRLSDVLRRADANPWRQRFYAAMDHGNWDEVLRLARQPESLDQAPVALQGLATLLAGKDRPAAVALLRRAQRRHPNDFWLNQNLGLFLLKGKKPDQAGEAAGFFRASVALRPESPGAHYNLGHALAHQRKCAEAADEFRQAIHLKPDYSQAHGALGYALYRQGRRAEAEKELRRAIDLDPDFAEHHAHLGRALYEQGRMAEAEKEWRQAVHLKPVFPEGHAYLGMVLVQRGKPAEAVSAFRQAIRLDPGLALAHAGLGDYLRLKGRFAEAEAEYRKAIRLQPDVAAPHFGLGDALYHRNRFAEAAPEFREAARLRPENALYHECLGFACDRQNDVDGAIAGFRAVTRLKPGHAKGHTLLGYALRKKGDLDGAIAAYRKALRADPNFALARDLLRDALTQKPQRGKPPGSRADKPAEAARK